MASCPEASAVREKALIAVEDITFDVIPAGYLADKLIQKYLGVSLCLIILGRKDINNE